MLRKRSTVAALTTVLVALALTPVPMTTAGAQTGGRLSQGPVAIALDHVRDNAADLGVARADVTDMAVASSYESSHNRVTHVNLTQRFGGLEVFGAHATVNVASDGEVLFVGDSLVRGLARQTASAPTVDAREAVEAAAKELDLDDPEGLRVIDGPSGRAEETVLSKAGISSQPIPARIGWHPAKSGLRLAWQLTIDAAEESHLWNATIDAATGELLKADDWTDRHTAEELATTLARGSVSAPPLAALTSPDTVDDGSSYRVFELPKESPNDGPRTLITNPADALASPFGWHDTDGVGGPEFTITRGNNVHAYTDRDADNVPDPLGDSDGGGGLDFDFPLDINEHPQNYTDAAVTNLFHWNNVVHDVTYRYGFDETAGNFQANNHGRAGTAGDYVRAEAQDGAGDDNANFSTPIETPTSGGEPRMQMFLWLGSQFGLPNAVTVTSGSAAGTYLGNLAFFTPAPTTAGFSGEIRLVNDGSGTFTDGCDPYTLPAGSIALVDGDGSSPCDFFTQATRAQAAGAGALVVAYRVAGRPPGMTGSMSPPVGIPATLISPADGDAIKAGLPASGRVHRNAARPPMRDGDFENGIIIHEYGHGVSNRLTGGPTVNCLTGDEQAGEGWSDYLAITMLLDPALDDPDEPRGMGPYVLFQDDRHGAGIRPRPYSRDMAIQPFTYDSIRTGGWLNGSSLALPHGLGHGWAAVLWDMTWDLIDKHGFNPNIYEEWDTGGNNRALQYVIDGLKMQGCGPGLVVARDAIIAAADELSDGEDTCTLWASFARRGLGFSAIQGTTARNDNDEAFDTHPDCREGFVGIAEGPTLNTVNRGEAVDMEFDAGGDRGIDVLASNSPYSRQVDCETLRTETPGAEFITPRPLPVPAETPGNSRLSFDPSPGRYTFPWKTLQAWGGTCREFVLTRDDGVQHRTYIRFQASPARELSGRVRDNEGEPIAQARVTLRGDNFYSTRADANGFYSLEGVPRGIYEATVSAGGCYKPATQSVDLSRPRTVNFTLPKRSDAFGYTCRLEAAPFEEAETVLPLTGDDIVTTIGLPFTFPFYGFPITRAHVCTNGFVEFLGPATTNCSAANAAIPTTERPNGQISAYWDDLQVDNQASIRAATRGTAPNRRFVIEFRNIHFFQDTNRRVDFNIVLFENGDIRTQYRNIANDRREAGDSATIGIETYAGNDALRFSFNEAGLPSGSTPTSLRYTPPPPLPSHTVSGHVRDEGGRPIANATVTIEGTPLTPATTDTDGFYSFPSVTNGTYSATATAAGCHDPQTQELVVSGPTTLDFRLPPCTTLRVSVASDGMQGNGFSVDPSVSADGRYVAFASGASTLVPGDTNGTADVFVHDRDTGATERVSVARDGTQGNGSSQFSIVSVSADARYVAFSSSASNLVPGDTNGRTDVFVHDRDTGATERVSVASDGAQGNGNSGSFRAPVSADGRYVAFSSGASNLVPGDTNEVGDIFVHDRDTGATERVSLASDGAQGNGFSGAPSVSADGRYVAFSSNASTLVPGDTNEVGDIFVHDRDTGATERVSVASDGAQGNGGTAEPSVSADGRYVAFASGASNLVPGDTNEVGDIFVHDRDTGATERVSLASNGTQRNEFSFQASVSADGRHVAFSSFGSLVPGDTNETGDVFVHDRDTGATERVSLANDGAQGNGFSGAPSVSADGQSVAFRSVASNLVPGDTNGTDDVFLHNRSGP